MPTIAPEATQTHLTFASAAPLREELLAAINAMTDGDPLTLDIQTVEMIDSSVLGLLAATAKYLLTHRPQSRFVVVNIGSQVRRVLDLVNFEKFPTCN